MMGFIFTVLTFYFLFSQFQTKSTILEADCQCLSCKQLSATAFSHGNVSVGGEITRTSGPKDVVVQRL